jgi:galactose-1-phosphate uridylyltransferase
VIGLLRAQGLDGDGPDPSGGDEELAQRALGLFASTHDVVVARRHVVDGAVTSDRLCSSGDLDPEEHAAFLALTVDALRDLTESNPHAQYVSVFQNWLRPAGASFDHLHKQLVAIDEWGPLMQRAVDLLAEQPDLFNTAVADFAAAQRLIIAENDGALALAGVGHRYPTIEVYATRGAGQPWQHDGDSLRAVSDLLHACHLATGAHVPSNEEWHYRPVGAPVPMPWRINLKWRVSTLAGFEGGTKINVNTIDPYTLRDTVVARLMDLRGSGRVRVRRVGDECAHRRHALDYASADVPGGRARTRPRPPGGTRGTPRPTT